MQCSKPVFIKWSIIQDFVDVCYLMGIKNKNKYSTIIKFTKYIQEKNISNDISMMSVLQDIAKDWK